MRTRAKACQWSVVGSPSFQRSPFARDVFLDPGRAVVPRITALLVLRSTITTASAPAMRQFRGSIDTPCNCCVRFVAIVTEAHATLTAERPATAFSGRSFTGWTTPAITGAFGYAIASHQHLVGLSSTGPTTSLTPIDVVGRYSTFGGTMPIRAACGDQRRSQV